MRSILQELILKGFAPSQVLVLTRIKTNRERDSEDQRVVLAKINPEGLTFLREFDPGSG